MSTSQSLNVWCPKCMLDAQRVETVLQERDYGEMVAVVIVERLFTHVAGNGGKKTCRDRLENPWVFTLCGMEEITRVRSIAHHEMARFEVAGGIKIVG